MLAMQKLGYLVIATAEVAMLCGLQPVQAQTVHAVLVGDTNSNLADGVNENLKKMNNLLTRLKIVGKITVSRKEIQDRSFTCANIRSAIGKLKVKSDDAVIFYYAGHGFRRPPTTPTPSKFPEFDCPRPDANHGLDLDAVVKSLTAKNPRFLLAMADACNVESSPAGAEVARAPVGSEEDQKAGLRRLFLGYKGTLVMSGAIPGEPAWYMNAGSSLGGFFTNQFLSVLNRKIAADADTVRWEDIAEQATKTIEIPDTSRPSLRQTPQYEPTLAPLVPKGEPSHPPPAGN